MIHFCSCCGLLIHFAQHSDELRDHPYLHKSVCDVLMRKFVEYVSSTDLNNHCRLVSLFLTHSRILFIVFLSCIASTSFTETVWKSFMCSDVSIPIGFIQAHCLKFVTDVTPDSTLDNMISSLLLIWSQISTLRWLLFVPLECPTRRFYARSLL